MIIAKFYIPGTVLGPCHSFSYQFSQQPSSKVSLLNWVFPDTDPEPRIQVQVIYKGRASRRLQEESKGNRIRKGERQSRGEISGEVPVFSHLRGLKHELYLRVHPSLPSHISQSLVPGEYGT